MQQQALQHTPATHIRLQFRRYTLLGDWYELLRRKIECDLIETYRKRHTNIQRNTHRVEQCEPPEVRLDEKKISWGAATRFFDKAAFAYHLPSSRRPACSEKTASRLGLSTNETTEPERLDVFFWLGESYYYWASICSPEEFVDGRFAFGPVSLDTPSTIELWDRGDLTRFIELHLHRCNEIEAQAKIKLPERPPRVTPCGPPTFIPTCRAAFVVAYGQRSLTKVVTIVLTGNTEGMMSSPPSFEDIPQDEILSRTADNIIDVKLEVAIKWLHGVQAREVAANADLKAKIGARRQAQETAWYNQARLTVERAHRRALNGQPLLPEMRTIIERVIAAFAE